MTAMLFHTTSFRPKTHTFQVQYVHHHVGGWISTYTEHLFGCDEYFNLTRRKVLSSSTQN